ncbi:Catalytic LigB subunit of aromatic ring-opening dioxygenase [Alteribacillus persepolensis]|uniref:Catalytic LigB subunit of aromatic ring-opening dioxygenase n=1 Tax=Alteribacillus persepolensis TaxID=568899 RepID=A0A1G8EDW1_9BACI|nr:extradiol ring-cleavage dioxygenase [Alteribacillus persepolensis]SDH68092.1 Catalytic LigB subunit of aromatic ring-opening dioxygenase [Alteribacillus persepolensis]
MGDILGVGLTHFPFLNNKDENMTTVLKAMRKNPNLPDELKEVSGWPEAMREEFGDDEGLSAAQKHREECVQEFRKLRQEIEEFNPDFIVVFGDDQYENFKEDIIPSFCIGAYDSVISKNKFAKNNVWDEDVDKTFKIQGHRTGGKTLASDLILDGFDVAYAYEPAHFDGLPHAFMNTVLYLDYDRKGFEFPLVPFQVNCYGRNVIAQKGGLPDFSQELSKEDLDPPAPTPKRCFELGAAVARSIKKSPYRVAVVASSSWSHAFLVEKNNFLYPDLEADRKLYNTMVHGEYDYWRHLSPYAIEESGQQEVLNWMCLLGAMEELGYKEPTDSKFIETYIMNSSKTFAVYK